jgi:uncharacterized membrane protein (UPF0127 family)
VVTALVIFLITCLFIGLRQIPRVHIDRPAGALVGAVLMVVLGVLTLDDAFSAIDLHTLLLLLGMMIITVYLRQARKRVEIGFMEYFRSGALITVLTIAAGILILAIGERTAQGAERPAAQMARPSIIEVQPDDPLSPLKRFAVVLLCDTDEARIRGLQGLRKLRPDEAALFLFDPPQHAAFWMASVAYPIDILFVDATGRVVQVYAGCRPGSRELYPSGVRVRWVIETAAGSGIRRGDRVLFRGKER